MNILQLLEKSPGGVIEWVERYSLGDNGEHVEQCQMNLDQLGCIRIEYQKDDGEWAEWHDSAFGKRSDTEMLNAILVAHAKASGFAEMLAALEEVDAYAYNPDGPYAWEVIEKVRAAIKKAKEESNG